MSIHSQQHTVDLLNSLCCAYLCILDVCCWRVNKSSRLTCPLMSAPRQSEMEMESLVMARKQLLQQWSGSLLGMRRRDEALSAMQEAVWWEQGRGEAEYHCASDPLVLMSWEYVCNYVFIPYCGPCLPQHCQSPADLAGTRDWRLQEIHRWRAGAKWDINYAAELVPDGLCHLQKADQSEAAPAGGSAGPLQHLPPHSEGDRAHPRQAFQGSQRTKTSVSASFTQRGV